MDTPRGNKRERKRNKRPSKRDLEEALQRANPPSTFPLTTPAFRDHTRDYATTVPASSAIHPTPSPSTQSGWTPYFPPAAMKSAPAPVPVRHYAEVTLPEREIPPTPNTPSANLYKLSSASNWEEEHEVYSDVESEEELSQ